MKTLSKVKHKTLTERAAGFFGRLVVFKQAEKSGAGINPARREKRAIHRALKLSGRQWVKLRKKHQRALRAAQQKAAAEKAAAQKPVAA